MKRNEIVFDQAFLESLKRIQIISRESSGGRLEGARVGRKTGSGIEFADWRPYLPGDSPREVDWRAFARLGRLFVRLRAREEASNVYILIDASASMAFPGTVRSARRNLTSVGRPSKFTFSRRIAGALAAVALSGLDAVTAGFLRGARCELSHGGELLTGEGRLPDVLRFLEGSSPGGETDLASALGGFLNLARSDGVLLLFSDFWSGDGGGGALSTSLSSLATSGFEGALVQVLDPGEIEPAGGGRHRLLDSETAEELELEVASAVREAYREERALFFEELKASAISSGFRAAALRTDVRLEDAVLVDLRRAGVVA